MKKLALLWAIVVAVAAVGTFNAFGQSGVSGFPRNPKFGSVAVTGSITSTKACAAGYTRMGPNLCLRDAPSLTGLARDACTTVAAPSGATVVLVGFANLVKSGNVIAFRETWVGAYTDNTCGTEWTRLIHDGAREAVAVAAGTNLSQLTLTTWVKVFGGNIYLRFEDTAENQGTSSYRIQGYFD